MFKEKIKSVFKKCAYQAVVYAEELIGSGNGKYKKEIAIDFLISKLPLYLKPFSLFFRKMLNELADDLIENAVEKLHSVQKQLEANNQ